MNELQIVFLANQQLNQQLIKEDHRQLITVYLISDGRERYRPFYCQYCGNKVASIEGEQVYAMSDVDDASRLPDHGKLTVYCNGKHCRTYYKFTLL